MQRVAGDLMRVSQPTACRIINRVSTILASQMGRYVNFPQTRVARTNMLKDFFAIADFPGVAGTVDGTHIGINNPHGPHAEVYRNRKRQFSLNVQVGEMHYINNFY
jgi:hypothetical protein